MLIMPRNINQTKICQNCKKEFKRSRFNRRLEDPARFSKRKFCTKACSGEFQRKDSPAIGAYRKRAMKFRGKTCEECGAKSDLHAHHQDGDIANNCQENIRTLCASCHLKLHWKTGKKSSRKYPEECSLCGKPSRKLGYCQMHYQRLKKYGDPSLTKKRVGLSFELVREILG